MHLMATYLLVLVDCALSTSENVPSPFLLINRYSVKIKHKFEYHLRHLVCFPPSQLGDKKETS